MNDWYIQIVSSIRAQQQQISDVLSKVLLFFLCKKWTLKEKQILDIIIN